MKRNYRLGYIIEKVLRFFIIKKYFDWSFYSVNFEFSTQCISYQNRVLIFLYLIILPRSSIRTPISKSNFTLYSIPYRMFDRLIQYMMHQKIENTDIQINKMKGQFNIFRGLSLLNFYSNMRQNLPKYEIISIMDEDEQPP